MLGAGRFPADLTRHLRMTGAALGFILLAIVLKFSLGIVHYRDRYCIHADD